MITNDPNRLLAIIKDRHILIERFGKVLELAKKDNAGDSFKVNRLLKHHVAELGVLENHLRGLIADRKMLDAIHLKNRVKNEEAEVSRLRVEVGYWGINE